MKIGNWDLFIFNPFEKIPGRDRIIGFSLRKDWHHEYELGFRFRILEYPHLTIAIVYTTKDKYVERFIDFRSKSYRKNVCGSTFYENRKYVQGIDEGRNSAG